MRTTTQQKSSHLLLLRRLPRFSSFLQNKLSVVVFLSPCGTTLVLVIVLGCVTVPISRVTHRFRATIDCSAGPSSKNNAACNGLPLFEKNKADGITIICTDQVDDRLVESSTTVSALPLVCNWLFSWASIPR